MTMLGDLQDFSLPELLKLMDQAAKTGQLSIWTSAGVYRIAFYKGRVVAAICPQPEQTLRGFLAHSGLISEWVMDQLASFCLLDEPLGICLRRQHSIAPAVLAQAFRQQLQLGVYPLLNLDRGQFRFTTNLPLPYREMTGLSQAARAVAIEGLRLPQYGHRSETDLPLLECCLCRAGSELPSLRLTGLEWSIWERVPPEGSQMQLAELNQRLEADLLEVRQACDRLLRVGVLTETEPEISMSDGDRSVPGPAEPVGLLQKDTATDQDLLSPALLNRFAAVLRSMQLK